MTASTAARTTASPRQWVIAPPHPARAQLARDAQIDPFVAQVLLNRGIDSPAAFRRFVACDFKELHPPEAVPNAAEAGHLLAAAARAGKTILLYGDYDVDGITGTTILWHVLKLAGANPLVELPSRFEQGYGLHTSAVVAAAAAGAEFIVTIDCGITATEPARRARELGIKLVITDHHQPGATLPDALLIVHPSATGAIGLNQDLSGAGVALKVAWAVAREMSGGGRVGSPWRETLMDCTSFAAMGLIADAVPIVGENRIIASFGLRQLRHTKNAGLQALLSAASLHKKETVDDYDVGFSLAPRLNAIGRMDHARDAVRLFTSAAPDEAAEIAQRLSRLNEERQRIEREVIAQAVERVMQLGLDRDGCRAIVVAGEDWHPGVIGIVAARLVEKFGRPTMLFSLKNGVGQGSGRSVRHFPLHEVLGECRAHLLSHGGHPMAAGAKIQSSNLEAFTAAFLEQAARRLTAADLIPKLHLDDEVSLSQVSIESARSLQRLAPHGVGNSRPRLASGVVQLAEPPRTLGARGNHIQFRVREGQEVRRVIGFGQGEIAHTLCDFQHVQLAFEPLLEEWKGRVSVSLKLLDWKPFQSPIASVAGKTPAN